MVANSQFFGVLGVWFWLGRLGFLWMKVSRGGIMFARGLRGQWGGIR